MDNKKLTIRWTRVPLNKEGDPEFGSLNDILKVFSPEDITVLVNRELYSELYRKESHAKRYQRQKESGGTGRGTPKGD